MNTTALLSTASSDDANAGSITVTASKHVVQSNFSHVSKGNWTVTLEAIEAYLVSKGERRQAYGADLIMFMERSFSGKYRNREGQRYHYQRIMPDGKWPEEDTLSKKLKRCKDKGTFQRRFNRIGTTAILKREHFDNREISHLDFKGRMYLRLIDTTNNNLSYFFRNDAVVDAFIKSALAFHRQQLKAKWDKTLSVSAGKPAVVGAGKPAVVYLENPQPLLYSEVDSRSLSGKNKSNSLKLVHPSSTGKNKKPTPEGIDDKKTSDFGIDDYRIAVECGLIPATDESAGAVQRKPSVKSASGFDVFEMWRNSVLVNFSGIYIHEKPTGKETSLAANFYGRFAEFFPTDSIANFFNHLAKNWTSASKDFAKSKLFGHGEYPEIWWLLLDRNCDHVLMWYREKLKLIAAEAEWKRESHERRASQSQQQIVESNRSHKPLAPYRDCDPITSVGRTFHGGDTESLEYKLASSRGINGPAAKYIESMNLMCRGLLNKFSVDTAASEARIEELQKLSDDEFEKYCC